MAAILDLSQFTFEGDVLTGVGEMVMDEFIAAPAINSIHTIFPDIVTIKEVGYIGEGGLVGKKNQGCDPEPQDWNINTRKVKWTPADWEILIHSCWKDLQSTAAVYSLKTGIKIPDFTDTDYMNIVVEVLNTAMQKFAIRFAWFNDVDAANVSDGGIITNGTDIDYFNLIDGFWKQLLTQAAANPSQRVTITENAGANYAAQALLPANVQGYLQKLYYQADLNLRGKTDSMIVCTQSFYDAYAMSLQGAALETMLSNLIDGFGRTLTYNGVPLAPIPVWDEIIASYENNGTRLNNPHRAVFTNKAVLGFGMDNVNQFDELKVWYDENSRKVKMEAMGQADAKLTNPLMFNLAI